MLWIKSFHIIAMVCWFAVLFYLPRLFVYHSMSEDSISKERFSVMERKLLRGIGLPSMIATIVLGFALVGYFVPNMSEAHWLWAKLVCVGLLVVFHHLCGRYYRQLRDNKCQKSHVFFRWFNEVPVVLLIAIVCLVTIKPVF